MKGIAVTTVLLILGVVTAIGVATIGILRPQIFPEPLRTFFLTFRIFIEIIGISWQLPEVRGIFILIFLPMLMGLIYIILGLIRGGK